MAINSYTTKLCLEDFMTFIECLCQNPAAETKQVDLSMLRRFVDFYSYAPNTVR